MKIYFECSDGNNEKEVYFNIQINLSSDLISIALIFRMFFKIEWSNEESYCIYELMKWGKLK